MVLCLEEIGGTVPRPSSGQAFVEDAAESIHVHLLIQITPIELLWRHINRSATWKASLVRER